MQKRIIYTTVEWFSPAEYPEETAVPSLINNARKMWFENNQTCTPEVYKSLEEIIFCKFLAENLSGWEDYFPSDNYGEFSAIKISIVDLMFEDETLPSIRAEAWIPVNVLADVSDTDLEEWLESEWGLQSGIMWGWDLADAENLDLAMEDNAGLEALWVETL